MSYKRFTAIVILFVLATGYMVSASEQILGGNLWGGLSIKNIKYNAPLEITTQDALPTDPYTIDHPPIIGFVPYIAISFTDENLGDTSYDAQQKLSYVGTSLVANPSANFGIGIFDTGASAHVIGYQTSQSLGLSGDYLTSNIMTIGGVSGFVDTYVSMPIGVFFSGLDAINQTDGSLDISSTCGQSNVSVVSGMQPYAGEPDLPTVIGCPMSVFYDVSINNDNPVVINKEGKRYKSPSLTVYDQGDLSSPTYSNVIPLELRPLGALSVTYTLSYEDILNGGLDFKPGSPSVITGVGSQSLYFVHAVDLEHNGSLAFDKDRFMFDTGAQSTLIGSRVAARLGLDPSSPDFEIQAMGVNGQIVNLPGFVIDSITIPTLGNWLTFTNVPVALLDVASPEGGTLDGIIGTNLLNNYNMVLRGGGMMLQDDPYIEFEPRQTSFILGDIAPLDNPDGQIDEQDFLLLASYWLMEPTDPLWNQDIDIAPWPVPDDIINLEDFAALASKL
ncbi:MAG: TIGR02281 family clan AA aspartic protease [Sedimentisphaeraceae bacterium JB056]